MTIEQHHHHAHQRRHRQPRCGHQEQKQDLAGTLIRSIIQGGVEPAPATLRREVLEVVGDCAEKYGFGSPFVGEKYLANRTPVMSMPKLELTPELTGEASGCTCRDK